MRKLYIEEYNPEVDDTCIEYEFLEYYYDTIHKVCVKKVKLNIKLEIGKIYAFSFEDENDENTYLYIVLKKDSEDVYYIAEHYKKLYTVEEKCLANDIWIKLDVKEIGINLDTVL